MSDMTPEKAQELLDYDEKGPFKFMSMEDFRDLARAYIAQAARFADLERQLAEARDKALEEAAVEMELAAHIMSHHGSDIEVRAYTNAAKAIRNLKGTP